MKYWKHINNEDRGMVNELSDYISGLENSQKIFLPDLRQADNLYLFSDYSGNNDQQLISYSILILDESSLNLFASTQRVFWENYSLGTRIIEYKKLNDGPRKRALAPFLQLCNNLNGLILHRKSLIFQKTMRVLSRQMPQNPNHALRFRQHCRRILNGLCLAPPFWDP